MEYVGLEDRDTTIPPVDSLAEALVLVWLQWHHQRIPEYEVAPLLVMPEHRLIWQCMQRVYRPDQTYGKFYASLLFEAERVRPNLLDVLLPSHSALFEWHINRLREDYNRAGSIPGSSNFDFWLERLRKVASARKLIADAQRIAEHAWRGDVDQALRVVGQIDQRKDVVRVDV